MNKVVRLDLCCEKGNLAPVKEWLTDQIYRHGMIYTPQELMQRVCGAPFDPAYYVNYLWDKYGSLYGIQK